MSEYRMGTKCVQAGYEPGNGIGCGVYTLVGSAGA